MIDKKDDFTLKEISELSNVSISTVSRVLADSPNVKDSTKKKVLSVIEMHTKRSNYPQMGFIAFIIPDITNQFFPLMLKGIEGICRSKGYDLLVCNTEGNSKIEEQILKNLIKINILGIVFVGSGKPSDLLVEMVQRRLPPIVFLDRIPSINAPVQSITTNNLLAMYQATKYLLSLGHKKILYLAGPADISTAEERYSGFLKALEDSKIDLSNITKINGNYDKITASQETQNLIDQKKFDYSAICASNDVMAFGAYETLRKNNYSIPADISIIGFDDIPTSSLIGLTTVRQPFEEMGKIAMLQLLSLIQDAYPSTEQIVLSSNIVIRETCMAAVLR
ncbi:MAG: LacI family transcriptional regulator [Spirochaetia bacterium]|jgi:LacI family transcriptional regulator|nr:LacI family transcriptional regulator [Spirochaetia bacterium]